MKTAPEIIAHLGSIGYTVGYDRKTKDVWIKPEPPKAIIERVIAREADLVAYLDTLMMRPASSHPFYVTRMPGENEMPSFFVCLECGVPWRCHGTPSAALWKIIEVDSIESRAASSVVIPWSAAELAEEAALIAADAAADLARTSVAA